MLVSQLSNLQLKRFCCQSLTSGGYTWFEESIFICISYSGPKELNVTVPVLLIFFKLF